LRATPTHANRVLAVLSAFVAWCVPPDSGRRGRIPAKASNAIPPSAR
jgi:hypothetical protein